MKADLKNVLDINGYRVKLNINDSTEDRLIYRIYHNDIIKFKFTLAEEDDIIHLREVLFFNPDNRSSDYLDIINVFNKAIQKLSEYYNGLEYEEPIDEDKIPF